MLDFANWLWSTCRFGPSTTTFPAFRCSHWLSPGQGGNLGHEFRCRLWDLPGQFAGCTSVEFLVSELVNFERRTIQRHTGKQSAAAGIGDYFRFECGIGGSLHASPDRLCGNVGIGTESELSFHQ